MNGRNLPNLLHPHLHILGPLDHLPIIPHHGLLALPLIAKHIPMPPHEDVIPLVVQRQHLSALELGGRGEEPLEQVRGEDTQRGLEVVQDEFRVVPCVVGVAGQFLPVDPVGHAEVEVRARGEVDDVEAVGFLLVVRLHEDHDGGVGAGGGERGDFPDGVFVRVGVGGAADVGAVGEEGGQGFGFGVEGGVEGGGDEDLGLGRRVEELGEFLLEEFGGERHVGRGGGCDGGVGGGRALFGFGELRVVAVEGPCVGGVQHRVCVVIV